MDPDFIRPNFFFFYHSNLVPFTVKHAVKPLSLTLPFFFYFLSIKKKQSYRLFYDCGGGYITVCICQH